MSYTEALARVAQIDGEVEALQGRNTGAESSAGSTSFAETLSRAQAQNASASISDAAATAASTMPSIDSESPSVSDTMLGSSVGSFGAMHTGEGGLDGAGGYYPAAFLPGSYAADALSGATTVSDAARSSLSGGQQQFAERLCADTGLDPDVVSAWLLAEESGVAAATREREGNNDWLNIGYTDAGTYGSADSVWSNPTAAAEATAGWLAGRETIPGYGAPSSAIQSILATAGQAPEQQIAAIQQSGWASSGYPDLPALFQQVAG